jgi:hypothetical protein
MPAQTRMRTIKINLLFIVVMIFVQRYFIFRSRNLTIISINARDLPNSTKFPKRTTLCRALYKKTERFQGELGGFSESGIKERG